MEAARNTHSNFAYVMGVLTSICFACLVADVAFALDWDAVPGKKVVVFQPGQASWEWVLTQSSHSGAKKFKKNKICLDCHKGEESDIGSIIASGEKLEPSPIEGNVGSVAIDVKFAHDESNLFVRLEWTAPKTASTERMDPDYETKITMMLGESNVREALKAGCWGTCHDDLSTMPSDAKVEGGMRKYLARSRTKLTRKGGGANYRSDQELDTLMAEGYYLEYYQARLNRGTPASAIDGYILKRRRENDVAITNVEAEFEDGKWTVVLSRPLVPGIPNHKEIVPGETYYIGFALHDSHKNKRFHKVSFGHSFRLDQGGADFIAVKL